MADEEKRKGDDQPEKEDEPFQAPSDDFQTSDEGEEQELDFGALTGGGPSKQEDEDQGLGDLPPLSDFESSEGDTQPAASADKPDEPEEEAWDSGLPPLSDLGMGEEDSGGHETPAPEAGRASDFESPASDSGFDTPTGESGFDTPTPAGAGFQDLTSDSDFSPETPDIGPGPDSDVETPMFDSAFGAGGDEPGGGDAPTRAMETPMFGGDQGGGGEDEFGAGGGGEFQGFEEGAFGAEMGQDAFGEGGGGTPMPDFSPDTGVTGAEGPPPGAYAAVGDDGDDGMNRGVLVVVFLLVGAIVGILGGPWVASQVGMPEALNPFVEEIQQREQQITSLQGENTNLRNQVAEMQQIVEVIGPGTAPYEVSPERITELLEQQRQIEQEIAMLDEELSLLQEELSLVNEDLERTNEEFVVAQQEYEDLLNETSITQARQQGLIAEVDRLTSLVGELEDANARRQATRNALQSAMERLAVQIEEGLPLTPREFDREERAAAAQALLDRIEETNWVDPDLLNDYTNLYLRELEIAESQKYFFARIPVRDRFGVVTNKWAECVMNGNWSVYYRTLDGRNIGVYANTAETGAPRYEFVEDFPREAQTHIQEQIFANRTPGYQERIQVLAQQEVELERGTAWQRVFDSL